MPNDKPQTTVQKSLSQNLRDIYATHPIVMQAANEIDRLEKKIKEIEGRREKFIMFTDGDGYGRI